MKLQLFQKQKKEKGESQAMSSPPPVDVEQKVMADSGVAATVSVSLHPLVSYPLLLLPRGVTISFYCVQVIMNISEHWTRVKAQEGRPVTVYGALIGRQVNICHNL